MAYFGRNVDAPNASRVVKIADTEAKENFTVYVIEVTIGQHRWCVRHRYSEFRELHEKLISLLKLEKVILPPKKIFGNQSEAFIRRRQHDLQEYLRILLQKITVIPECLAKFLHFDKYEVHGITDSLAEQLYEKGDLILEAGETFHTSPLQLHAITTRLKLPEPTCASEDTRKDIGHILDFVTRLKMLKIQGTKEPLGGSNIISHDLDFDLGCFKALECLQLTTCNPEKLFGIEQLKMSLKRLCVSYSIKTCKEILLADVGAGQWLGGQGEAIILPAWSSLTSADFSHNNIITIDESVKLLPRVESLDLSHNQISCIDHLQHLSNLTRVDLSHNSLTSPQMLHTRLGNVTVLNLAHNNIDSLQGFSKLYSLQILDISHNGISQVLEVRHISSLPCLESLKMMANPVTIVLDYRTKVLELFGDRASEVRVDGQRPTQKELDTVAILLAIQKSKETKERHRKPTKKPPKEVTISEQSTSHEPSRESQALHVPEAAVALEEEHQKCSGNQMCPSVDDSCRADLSEFLSNDPGDIQTICDRVSAATLSLPPRYGDFMLPETLPGRNDSTFVMYTQALIPDTREMTERCGMRNQRDQDREERTVHLLWCPVICYTKPYTEIPVCILITTENIHFFRVTVLKGELGFPELDHIYCIPLMNIQQLVLGFRNLYLRLEESSLGPQGTYTLLTGNVGKTDLFLDSLKLAYRRAVPDLDQYEDPHVVVNGETGVNLKTVINRIEGYSSSSSVQIVTYMLVFAPHLASPTRPFVTHSLVLTSRYLYLLAEDYILWPQPTFALGPSNTSQFEVLQVFPVMGRINTIQMYDSDTYITDGKTSLSQTFSATQSSAMVEANFVGYGVKLTFELVTNQTNSELDIRVPTSGMRDSFLASLTTVRRQMADRGSTKAHKKSKPPESDAQIVPSMPESRTVNKTQMAIPVGGNEKYDNVAASVHVIDDDVRSTDPLAMFTPADTTQDNMASSSVESGGDRSTDSLNIFPSGSSHYNISGDHQSIQDFQNRESPTGQSDITSDSYGADRSYDMGHDDIGAIGGHTVKQPAVPPCHLDVGYPSVALLEHLSQCNEHLPLLTPISPQMRNLSCMLGEEILNFFHNSVAQISMGAEELQHLLWTMVTPYLAPKQEILSCILMSTSAIYLLTDEPPTYKAWPLRKKTHSRNKSDSFQYMAPRKAGILRHNTSGILHSGENSKQKIVKTYLMLPLCDLQQVDIGMFDQCFRLVGTDADRVVTCVTRDNSLTEGFLKKLMSVLSKRIASPSPVNPNSGDSEPDFYKMFNKYGRSESLEYRHPSKVRFIYPSDDFVADLTYLMVEQIKGRKPRDGSMTMLAYLLLFQTDNIGEDVEVKASEARPCTLLLSSSHIGLAKEDLVSYPLTDFALGLPEHPQLEWIDVRNLELLQRVVVSDFRTHDLMLLFRDESEEIQVDTSLDHYGPESEATSDNVPEIKWTLIVQNLQDKDRLLKYLKQRWCELHDRSQLSVQVNT